MDVDQLIPPVLQPYKQWISLALLIIVFVIRPSLPAPKADAATAYVFIFNVIDKLSGSYGGAAHTPENIPVSAQAALPVASESAAATKKATS